MSNSRDERWIDERLLDRSEQRKQSRIEMRNPGLTVIDASKFGQQLADLTLTLSNSISRHGPAAFGSHAIQEDIEAILIQLRETYNLLRFINADQTRDENPGYRRSYSFVSLPLVRTMIDGFYNCTALLDDPSRVRQFRASGLYRIRESIQANEARYGNDPEWALYLGATQTQYKIRMRAEGFVDSDLDIKKNKWPLLAAYLKAEPDTPHKRMLRKLTLGFWKEYSSISHASHDGISSIFPFMADSVPHSMRPAIKEAVERQIAVHFGRAAGLLLCLVTEVQNFCRFAAFNIDQRLSDMWMALMPVVEVRELFDYRYHSLLRIPVSKGDRAENNRFIDC